LAARLGDRAVLGTWSTARFAMKPALGRLGRRDRPWRRLDRAGECVAPMKFAPYALRRTGQPKSYRNRALVASALTRFAMHRRYATARCRIRSGGGELGIEPLHRRLQPVDRIDVGLGRGDHDVG